MIFIQITIDGPAGAGKSTIARMLANQLGFLYIDTGAMYRTITYLAMQQDIPFENEEALYQLIADTEIELVRQDNGSQAVYCNGINVTEEIRAPLISQNVSKVAMLSRVREELVKKQRSMAEDRDVVMDGRDAGTVILPHAECKIFLVASLEERARRRLLEMHNKGYEEDFASIKKEMAQRDYLDEHRSSSPLKPAHDAVLIDTTALSPAEVITAILAVYEQRINRTRD